MLRRVHLGLALLASLSVAVPAHAGDDLATGVRAQLTLGLGFAGPSQPVHPSYTLAVSYRSAIGSPDTQLVQLDVSDTGALARLAGLPLFAHGYRLNATDAPDWRTADDKPWYAHSWVYWTLGGIAAAAVAGTAGHSADNTTNTQVSGGPKACGTQGIDGLPDTCVAAPH